jgi:hypothetical protein
MRSRGGQVNKKGPARCHDHPDRAKSAIAANRKSHFIPIVGSRATKVKLTTAAIPGGAGRAVTAAQCAIRGHSGDQSRISPHWLLLTKAG